MVAVEGLLLTDGRTSNIHCLRSAFDAAGQRSGMILLIWSVGCGTWRRPWSSGFQDARLLDHARSAIKGSVQRIAAQALPVVGALGGAVVDYAHSSNIFRMSPGATSRSAGWSGCTARIWTVLNMTGSLDSSGKTTEHERRGTRIETWGEVV